MCPIHKQTQKLQSTLQRASLNLSRPNQSCIVNNIVVSKYCIIQFSATKILEYALHYSSRLHRHLNNFGLYYYSTTFHTVRALTISEDLFCSSVFIKLWTNDKESAPAPFCTSTSGVSHSSAKGCTKSPLRHSLL